MLTITVYLSCVGLFLIILNYYFKYRARAVRKLPSPKDEFLFGNGRDLIAPLDEVFKIARRYAKTFEGIYGWYSLTQVVINLYNPEDIETVISSSKNTEKSFIYKFLHPWLREGLLVSKGSKWMHRRKILTPTFHFNILKRFATVMEENSQSLVKKLAQYGGKPLNIIPIISEYTLNGICETAMGIRLEKEKLTEGEIYKNSLQELSNSIVHRMARFYYYSDSIFKLSAIGRHFSKNLKAVTDFTKNVISERKDIIELDGSIFSDCIENDEDNVYFNSKKKKVAMLDLMISAQKEGAIDSAGIQEEVDTFMFEGHDTTASGLDFCLMLLANHKSIQDKILEEQREIFGDSNRPAKMDDLNAMKYLECCIKESLRLYPPVPFIGRKLSDSTVLSGHTIPAGIQCHIHIWDLHHNPKVFPDPEKFDPGRFLPDNSVGRHPYAFIPFSAGPRNCIGQRFAMLEMKSCVSSILRKFELQPVTKPSDLVFVANLVLRCTNPVYVKFTERISSSK